MADVPHPSPWTWLTTLTHHLEHGWRPSPITLNMADNPHPSPWTWLSTITMNMTDVPHPLPSPWNMTNAPPITLIMANAPPIILNMTDAPHPLSHHLEHGWRPSPPLSSPWTWLTPLTLSHHFEHGGVDVRKPYMVKLVMRGGEGRQRCLN